MKIAEFEKQYPGILNKVKKDVSKNENYGLVLLAKEHESVMKVINYTKSKLQEIEQQLEEKKAEKNSYLEKLEDERVKGKQIADSMMILAAPQDK